jgi:bacterioferritin-associated ferredoxin
MDTDGLSSCAGACEVYVCACLRLTHADLLAAIACLDIRTLQDLRRGTGAGGGCMACPRRLRGYLEAATSVASDPHDSAYPICSVR